ncbi:MAG: ATP-binding cassette domain-containing protein [Solirubrobacteraceae bacterium]
MSTLKGTPPAGAQAGELLEMTDVSKRYRRGSQSLRVLEGASLQVGRGEVVCVLASRGAGKTTLLRIAAGMESADEGRVSFDGQDLAALSDGELSRLLGSRIAWASKSGPGMRTRMLDYVSMPLLVSQGADRKVSLQGRWRAKQGVDDRAMRALERVGAETCAGQEWESMSDWERALVEIAQAIAGEPALLLVDDLTDALGIRETDELTALIASVARESKMGVLMAASDAQATLLSDRIVTLAGGRLTQCPQSPSGNVIEFPDLAVSRRDVS